MLNQETFASGERTDAVIVGGGVIGLAIARALRLGGLESVTLVERGRLGMEASHAAAGMLAPQVEADCPDAFLQLACQSRDMYPAFAAALLEETGIDIELEQTGTLLLSFTDEDESEARRRYDWQSRAGLCVEQLSDDEARELEPCLSPRVRGALRFSRDWQVENRRLVAALAASATRLGVKLLTGTHVESLRTERGRVTGVETSRGRLNAAVVVVASGAWTFLLGDADKRSTPVRIEPVRGQILCFEAPARPARHVIYSPRGYIVPRLDGRLLAGSTVEHAGYEKCVTGYGLQKIMAQALEIAPVVGQLALMDAWAGLRPRAEDDLPVLGISAEVDGLCYATGHYRNGILLAPLTGEIIAEQVMSYSGGGAPLSNERSRQLSAFSPDRFQLATIG